MFGLFRTGKVTVNAFVKKMCAGMRRKTSFRKLCCPFFVTSGVLVLLSVTSVAPAASDSPPNILMILTDDQGWGDVAAYGAKALKPPALDTLVATGMRFDN